MLAHARSQGAAIERGVMVRSIDDVAHTDDGGDLGYDALFLASGKHDIRGLARPSAVRGGDPMLGLRVRLSGGPALTRLVGDAVELHLFDRGYAGIVQQEDGSVNVCLAVRRSRLREAGDPASLLRAVANEAPSLGDRLAWLGDQPIDAIANVPYGWRASPGDARLFRLGDQSGVIPSLAGEGMAIAVTSGVAAAAAYLRRGAQSGSQWQADFRRALRRPIGVASGIMALAERPPLAGPLVALMAGARILPRLLAELTRMQRSR
jgi:hypothetical protein